MLSLVSMASIRKDFDAAMEKQGYVRAKVMCEKWCITSDQLSRLIKKGFECDTFIVNGVRYISKDTPEPCVKL